MDDDRLPDGDNDIRLFEDRLLHCGSLNLLLFLEEEGDKEEKKFLFRLLSPPLLVVEEVAVPGVVQKHVL